MLVELLELMKKIDLQASEKTCLKKVKVRNEEDSNGGKTLFGWPGS